MRVFAERPDVAPLALGCAIALGVSLPFFSSGRILLLDWSLGPHVGLVPNGVYGLNNGLTSGVPLTLAVNFCAWAVGRATTWLALALFFPLAAVSASRLAGGSILARLGTASLYCVNPFIFERVFAGHMGLLLGYALLPLAIRSALRALQDSASVAWLGAVLWWAVLTALSVHFVWIFGIVMLVAWLTHRPLRRVVMTRALAITAAFLLLSLYVLFPHLATQLPSTTRTASDLGLYHTIGDPHLGLIGNALGLYGFWRVGPELPKNVFSGWPFLILAILVVAGIGAFDRIRRQRSQDSQLVAAAVCRGTTILAIGVAGYFLALGDQGPIGPLFRWAYFHLPFFAVMREPEKFLMLTALALAVFFGWGVERLSAAVRRLRFDLPTAGAFGLAVMLPLGYTSTIFDGLAGQIRPSQLPPSWSVADRLMGGGPGQILFLPWHLYMAFPFTGGRVIANPAPTSFRRSVISGDNVEAGKVESSSASPRSTYLQHLYAQGPELQDFGRLVAPLGVKYVVVAKAVDWQNYEWLRQQTDLVPVMDSGSLQVWRNADYAGVGQASRQRSIRQISPVAYSIGPGPPGDVTLDADYQEGWQLGTQKAQETPQGTIRFHVGSRGGIVQFTPWGITRLGYIVSGSTFVALLGVVIADRLRRGGRNQRRTARRAGVRGANPSCPG